MAFGVEQRIAYAEPVVWIVLSGSGRICYGQNERTLAERCYSGSICRRNWHRDFLHRNGARPNCRGSDERIDCLDILHCTSHRRFVRNYATYCAEPNARTDDGNFLIALLSRSRTIAQVKENPLVEICFVDRKMWYCRVTGKAKISDSKENKEIVWNNVPMLKQYFGGIEDPNFILMEVEILNVEAMTPHQKEPESISF